MSDKEYRQQIKELIRENSHLRSVMAQIAYGELSARCCENVAREALGITQWIGDEEEKGEEA